MKTYVLYHYPCPDGTAAAMAALLAFRDDVVYVPTNYGKEVPIPDNSLVYFVDFSWPRKDLDELVSRGCSVVVLDHHKTAAEALAGVEKCDPNAIPSPGLRAVFDMSKSGARIAWEFFHPGHPIPWLIKLVEDRDIWKWEYNAENPGKPGGDTAAFAAWLKMQEPTPVRYAEINGWIEQGGANGGMDLISILSAGRLLLEAEAANVEVLAKKAFWTKIGEHRVVAANAPILQSEVGHALLEKQPQSPFSAVFSYAEDEQGQLMERWSLRGRGDFDVSAIAKQFPGGGGHFSAAGFSVPSLMVEVAVPVPSGVS